MANLLVLLVLVVTICLSSLFSPVSGAEDEFEPNSLLAWFGDQGNSSSLSIVGERPVPPGSVLELPPPLNPNTPINVCFAQGSSGPPEVTCLATEVSGPPENTDATLFSTNSDVAAVEADEDDVFLRFKGFGSTTVQLLQNGSPLVSYVLIFSPVPGRLCLTEDSDPPAVMDCSGKCVAINEALERLGNNDCDDGSQRDDFREPIALSCASFIPELLLTVSLNPIFLPDQGTNFIGSAEVLARLTKNRDLDGGDCSLQESCTVQFGNAPGYEFCPAIPSNSDRVCSFNATTDGGTCAAMCQRFGSSCVAALDNGPPGCTPLPHSADTCETPRQTEICVCERR
jgi:hypothetical protein